MSSVTRLLQADTLDSSDNAGVASARSRFLELPLEVRRYLYDLLLGVSYRDHLNLLSVNKQVYAEARESFYRRPLWCNSQLNLVSFVKCWPQSVLQSISHLRLRLEEIKPELMQEYVISTTSSGPLQPGRHPYLSEIDRITRALSKLPRITHLQLLRPGSPQKSLPSSIVMTGVLNWVSEHCSRLQSLKLDIEQCHIDCLGSLTKLRSLCLTGYSETSSTRTADVLSKLTNLEELQVVGPPTSLQMLQRHGHQTKIVQSVNHQLLERVRPLKRLTLAQIRDAKSESSVFFTFKMMKALYEVHVASLQALTISSNTVPSSSFVEYLSAFLLATPNIHELSLTWPEMETAFVDCIPNSVRRLEFAVASTEDAQSIIDRLSMVAYRLRYLRDIRFQIINPAHEVSCETGEEKQPPFAFSLPIQNLIVGIASPFNISYGIWQPTPSD